MAQYRRGGFCRRCSPLTQGVSHSPRSFISMGVRKESQYSSMPVTLDSDQMDGSNNRMPKPKMHAGAQTRDTLEPPERPLTPSLSPAGGEGVRRVAPEVMVLTRFYRFNASRGIQKVASGGKRVRGRGLH